MAIRIALLGGPIVAGAVLALLLNWLDAGVGISVVALGSVCVAGGAALGYFGDRLPEPLWGRRIHRLADTHRD